MRFFSTQPTPAAAPLEPVRPTEKATVADIMLAYRLILKREADPAGLAAYSQRVQEGLTLEELLQSLLDSSEREDRIRTDVVQPGAARVAAADASLIDPKEVMRRYSVAELNETADEYYRVMPDPDLTLRKPFQAVNETPEMLENLGALLGGLQYNALFDSSVASLELRSATWQRMHDTMLNRTVFFLHKGEPRLDSRGHVGLAHRMSVHPETVSSPDGDPVTLTFTITNTGTAHWLNQGPHIFGLVRLACHSYDEHGALLNLDHFRSELPGPVAPGDTVRMTVTVPVFEQRPCLLGFDLVAEGVRWFEKAGSKPAEVRIDR